MVENVLAMRCDRSLTDRTVMLKVLDEVSQKYSQMYMALNKDYEH